MNKQNSEFVKDYTVADLMTCAMSRMIKDKETAFHGVSSHMPMISILLAKNTHAPDAVHLNIPGGVSPNRLNMQVYSSEGGVLCANAEAIFNLQDIFDLSMRGKLDVAFLSGIQFDVHGNVNASVIGEYKRPKVRMPGGAGSAVLIPTAKRSIIWRTKHDKRTFVEKVDFVTTRGNIHRIVTPLCIFKIQNGKVVLDTIHPFTTFKIVQENTAFELSAEGVGVTRPPTVKEIKILKAIDPNNYRSIEF